MKQTNEAINDKIILTIKQFKKEYPDKDVKELPIEFINIYKSDKKPQQQPINSLDYTEEED